MKTRMLMLAMLLLAGTATSGCGGSQTTSAPDASVAPLTTQAALRDDLRTLFMDRATWVRLYLIDSVGKSADLSASTQRLMQNQTDIGNAVVPFYGSSAGAQLTTLLEDGVNKAAATVTAAMNNDAAGFATAKTNWYASADRVAAFLASANPNWPQADLQAALHTCIDDAIAEASARMSADWAADVTAADATMKQAIAVADVLADGIEKQFPDKVGPLVGTSNAEALHLGMRALFQDRAAWVHEYLVDAVGSQPSTSTAAQRLMQNQVDIGNAIVPFYGSAAGSQLTTLLQQGVNDAAAAVTAALANDSTEFNTAKTNWYANADQVAAFLAGANPNWKQSDLQTALHTCIDDALADATAQMGANWTSDVAATDTLRAQGRGVADALSAGVIAQFNP